MKKEKFEEFLNNLKIEKEKWLTFTEIESIILNDGRGIYPNWIHMRFLITKNGDILIKHGESTPYGSRFGTRYSVSYDGMNILFPLESVQTVLPFCQQFRLPKKGDILRSTIGCSKVLSESFITDVSVASNAVSISLSSPVKYSIESRLSFYDPTMFDKLKCIHATEAEGLYAIFNENEGKDRRYGRQHEVIKPKQIKEINLRLLKENKVYKIK